MPNTPFVNNCIYSIVDLTIPTSPDKQLGPHLGLERPRVYSDLSPKDKERYNADIRATNILLQGQPKDIYSLINHYTDAKDIWDNVKMLLEGSKLTKEDHESQLYDDFEHFHQNKGETIHDYYIRFSKLINDMRNIKMTMSRMQLNSKFMNNMLPEWGRFVTAVKLNRGLRDSNYDQLYAYLKQHEAHANENKMMMDRFTQHTVDLLALMSNVSHHQHYSQSSTTPPSTYVPSYFADNTQLDSGLSPTDNLIENLTNILALLTQSYKTYLHQTNNCKDQVHSFKGRQVVVQNVQGQQNTRQGNNARGTGAAGYGGAQNKVRNANPSQARQIKCIQLQRWTDNTVDEDVDEQPVQYLALTMDNVFQANDYDAFDSDIDEAPTAQTMFMANLSSANPIYGYALDLSYDSDILSEDLIKMKAKALKEQTPASRPIKALMVCPPNTPATLIPRVLPTKMEKGFEQTKECYLTKVIPFFKTLKEHFEGIQKALTKEVKEIKEIFEELEAELTVSRFTEMHDAYTIVQARYLELEAELS
ncbi:hypothetical protein Tco_0622671 [Tanacetum coccineum]